MTSRRRLLDIATTYLLAVHDARPPLREICVRFEMGATKAHELLGAARQLGYLPAHPPAEGHWPRTASWRDQEETWIACRCCRRPWPCTHADTLTWLERLPRLL
jgi:hypothetical protein